MDPVIGGALIGGLGSLASSAFSLFNQGSQRNWQERMANTAHQREVADLRAAGLNPILSATGGSGAATPTPLPAKIENAADSAANAYSAVNTGRIAREQLELQKDLNLIQVEKGKAEIGLTGELSNKAKAEAENQQLQNISAFPQILENLKAQHGVLSSQQKSNLSSAALADYQAQVRSPMEVLGKMLEGTLLNKGGLSIQGLLKSLIGTILPSGQETGLTPKLPSKSRHSAKEK